jgi:hypothetical protein
VASRVLSFTEKIVLVNVGEREICPRAPLFRPPFHPEITQI